MSSLLNLKHFPSFSSYMTPTICHLWSRLGLPIVEQNLSIYCGARFLSTQFGAQNLSTHCGAIRYFSSYLAWSKITVYQYCGAGFVYSLSSNFNLSTLWGQVNSCLVTVTQYFSHYSGAVFVYLTYCGAGPVYSLGAGPRLLTVEQVPSTQC